MRKKRVAIYLPSLHGGGAERVMVILANAFSSSGFDVDLVAASAQGPYLVDVDKDVRVVDLKASRVLSSTLALACYLRRYRPAAMLSAMNHANVVAILAHRIARASATRLVISERNTITKLRATNFRTRWMPFFMRFTYPKADVVVAVSEGVRDSLIQTINLPKDKIKVIYNPVVYPGLFDLAGKCLDHPWFCEGSPPVVIGVGRLTAQKDFSSLLRAFSCIRCTRVARLVILGEGELRPALEALSEDLGISKDVMLPGFIDNPFPWMSRAAVFVLSSAWEGLPGVLIQAMACGTPVVSTDCPSGPAEILENGRWGRLVPVGDVEALAAAIEATLDENIHVNVAQRALDFDVEYSVNQYLNVMGLSK